MEAKLTVYFDDPFWVGVFERAEDGKLCVCKVTFGAEPKDYEVWEFVLKHYYELEFSPVVETGIKHTADTPKRRQRKPNGSSGFRYRRITSFVQAYTTRGNADAEFYDNSELNIFENKAFFYIVSAANCPQPASISIPLFKRTVHGIPFLSKTDLKLCNLS